MTDDDYAIRVRGLGKHYRLGQTVDLARNFRETLETLPRWLGGKAKRAMRERLAPPPPMERDTEATGEGAIGTAKPGGFWALRDIDFEIKPGERVGIIGRNGAGKSTLLKILCRITWPTVGEARIRGRVGSLLEVGTGFHPELTGRENVFLNGAILGMRRSETARKFDEIVAFAAIDKFLDTPVKRYSSGMRVRLAFAVAAHLDPEVLVVDEVLAVGDAEFQQRCLGKMEEATGGGRTVLFVSHNMAAVRQLCSRGILLKEGQVAFDGGAADAIDEYMSGASGRGAAVGITADMHYRKDPPLEIFRAGISGGFGIDGGVAATGGNISFKIDFRAKRTIEGCRLGIVVRSRDAVRLATVTKELGRIEATGAAPFRLSMSMAVPFLPGRYQWEISVKNKAGEYVDFIQGLPLQVEDPTGELDENAAASGFFKIAGDWTGPRPLAEDEARCSAR